MYSVPQTLCDKTFFFLHSEAYKEAYQQSFLIFIFPITVPLGQFNTDTEKELQPKALFFYRLEKKALA